MAILTKALRRFVRDAELARGSDLSELDASHLRIARQQLHQAVGALEMVGLEAPAKVLRAMQALPQVAPWVEEAQGQFVFLTSDFAQIGAVQSSRAWVYHVSKAALNMAVVAAQPDYPKAQFLLIHPGWVRTEMGTPDAPLLPEESVAAIRATVAARKTDKADFVCSDVPYLRWDGSPFSSW